MISAILLAAGESRRMGQLKQLLPLGSGTVIQTCLETLLASTVDEVIVVLGHRSQEIRAHIEHLPVHIAINAAYRQGMSSSVKCGLRAVRPEARAMLVALVDQPLVTSDIVDRLIDVYLDAYLKGDHEIVIPEFEGRSGHPIVIDMTYREAILEVDLQQGLRQVIYANPDHTVKVCLETDAVIQNMNTWDDYQRTVKRIRTVLGR